MGYDFDIGTHLPLLDTMARCDQDLKEGALVLVIYTIGSNLRDGKFWVSFNLHAVVLLGYRNDDNSSVEKSKLDFKLTCTII